MMGADWQRKAEIFKALLNGNALLHSLLAADTTTDRIVVFVRTARYT